MEAFEYAIRKDVRNNPIIREIDRARLREMWRGVGVGVVLAGLLLYSAWQHFELIRHGYRIERLQEERAAEEQINQHLRLQLEVLKSPRRIEALAKTRLKMVEPALEDAVVLERVVAPAPPAKSVVASR